MKFHNFVHNTVCTKSCIPADYMLSTNSALEGAACKEQKNENFVILPYALPLLLLYVTLAKTSK